MKVILGAGITKNDGWISTQENELNILNLNDWKKNFNVNSIDCILAEHVWEHMSYKDGIIAAKNCFKYLKLGGYLRCAVPDGNFKNKWYQNMIQAGGPGPKEHPAYTHKIVYDYKSLSRVFFEAGFDMEILEYCDEKGNFHYKYWNENDGIIGRSYRFDARNKKNKLGMVSIIIDAKKPLEIKYEEE